MKMKTLFEETCDMVGAAYDSEAAERLAEIVDDLIWGDDEMDDQKIMKEAAKRFNELYC